MGSTTMPVHFEIQRSVQNDTSRWNTVFKSTTI